MSQDSCARSRARDATPDPPVQTSLFEGGCGWCVPCYAAGSPVLAVDERRGSVCAAHARAGMRAAAAFPSVTAAKVVAGAAAAAAGATLSRPESPDVDDRVEPAVAAVLAAWRAVSGGHICPTRPAAGPARGAGRGATQSRGARGRRARAERRAAERARSRTEVHQAARRRARALHVGRRRAAARLKNGYDPHPGWRNFVPPGFRVLTSQTEVLALLHDVVAAQPWRRDRAESWTAILHTLVAGMDWDTGLITAVTATRLAGAGDRSTRTVSRVIAWALDAGVLCCLEPGASADFLGTNRGRTPTYVFTTNTPLPDPAPPASDDPYPDDPNAGNPLVTASSDELGDLPTRSVEITTRTRRLEQPGSRTSSWPAWQIPETSAERSTAARCLLTRLRLDNRGVSGRTRGLHLPRWWAMLKPWWDAGWCPRSLEWALHHHPDAPDRHRGDLTAGATDLLAVLGARLAPWRHRLGELPPTLAGIRGDYRTVQADRLTARTVADPTPRPPSFGSASGTAAWTPHSRPETRAAAHAALAAARAGTRARRAHSPAQPAPSATEPPESGQLR